MLTTGTSRRRIRNFSLHPLVNVAEPLTDEGAHQAPLTTVAVGKGSSLNQHTRPAWHDIAPQLYSDLGRCVAHNILVHHGARNVLDVAFDWDGVMPELVEQPAALSDQGKQSFPLPSEEN